MELQNIISNRRSIRKYKNQPVAKDIIDNLLEAAIWAPSAFNSQPWSFVIIQDPAVLTDYSERAKPYLIKLLEGKSDLHGYKKMLSNPDFNIFYNASTLIIIYATTDNYFAAGDCCLAAQNLMLSAHDLGLGSCWIGFSTPFFNSSELKKELDIPAEYTAVAPLIVGYPEFIPSKRSRKPPEILLWK